MFTVNCTKPSSCSERSEKHKDTHSELDAHQYGGLSPVKDDLLHSVHQLAAVELVYFSFLWLALEVEGLGRSRELKRSSKSAASTYIASSFIHPWPQDQMLSKLHYLRLASCRAGVTGWCFRVREEEMDTQVWIGVVMEWERGPERKRKVGIRVKASQHSVFFFLPEDY